MRNIIFFIITLMLTLSGSAQTFHAIIFSDMKESDSRSPDRTEEMNNMYSFCQNMAEVLGYEQDIRCHSDNEFTSTQFLQDIESMSVDDSDVVILFYNGHGCNWDNDDWPHMAFRDVQYWQTTAYERLQEKFGNAKLLLCIACCCNMDSRGSAAYSINYDLDPNKACALFTGFSGKRKIITSSSRRGQYSYSWIKGNNWRPGIRIGSIYGISLREAVNEVLQSYSSIEPTWENVLALAKKKTLAYTGQQQCPQYIIHDEKTKLSPRAQRLLNEFREIPSFTAPVKAKITSMTLTKNVNLEDIPSLVINIDFDIDNLSDDGGRVVAFLENPKGISVKDTNGHYCTFDGNVSVGRDFGTRQKSTSFNNFQLTLPMEELHITDLSKPYYIKVGVYDYHSKKYIAFSAYIEL